MTMTMGLVGKFDCDRATAGLRAMAAQTAVTTFNGYWCKDSSFFLVFCTATTLTIFLRPADGEPIASGMQAIALFG